jgi:hypothetical protein
MSDKAMTPQEWGEAWRDRAKELQVCGSCFKFLHCTPPAEEGRFYSCPVWKFGG